MSEKQEEKRLNALMMLNNINGVVNETKDILEKKEFKGELGDSYPHIYGFDIIAKQMEEDLKNFDMKDHPAPKDQKFTYTNVEPYHNKEEYVDCFMKVCQSIIIASNSKLSEENKIFMFEMVKPYYKKTIGHYEFLDALKGKDETRNKEINQLQFDALLEKMPSLSIARAMAKSKDPQQSNKMLKVIFEKMNNEADKIDAESNKQAQSEYEQDLDKWNKSNSGVKGKFLSILGKTEPKPVMSDRQFAQGNLHIVKTLSVLKTSLINDLNKDCLNTIEKGIDKLKRSERLMEATLKYKDANNNPLKMCNDILKFINRDKVNVSQAKAYVKNRLKERCKELATPGTEISNVAKADRRAEAIIKKQKLAQKIDNTRE